MQTTVLHQEDGSYTVEVPHNVISELELKPGAAMDISVEEQKVILQPRRGRYTLEQ